MVADGVRYEVHGIAHGQRGRFNRASAAVRDLVAREVAAWTAEPGSMVLTEPHLARLFDLDRSLELVVVNPLRRLPKRVLFAWLLKILVMLPLVPFAGPVMVVMGWLTRDPEYRMIRLALRDPEALPELRAHYDAARPPVADLVARFPRDGAGSFGLAYSMNMADAVRSRVAGGDVVVVHLLVGLAHERELAYLLAQSATTDRRKAAWRESGVNTPR